MYFVLYTMVVALLHKDPKDCMKKDQNISCSRKECSFLFYDVSWNVVKARNFQALVGTATQDPGLGVLDEPYSAKPAQQSSHTVPPGNIG
jgi:hypothetical protein